MIGEGLVLMGVGVGTVMLFLTLMVLCTYGSAAVVRRIEAARARKATNGAKQDP